MRRRQLLCIILLLSCATSVIIFSSLIWNHKLTWVKTWNYSDGRISHHAAGLAMEDRTHAISASNSNNYGKNDSMLKLEEGFRGAFVYHNSLLPNYPRNISELFDRMVPNNVFFVWCGTKVFEFKHYLSVLGVWHHLEPDTIELWYENPPREDKYNTWLTRLRTHIPVFSLKGLPHYASGSRCGMTFGLELLLDRGGLFINDGVVLHSTITPGLVSLLTNKISIGVFPDKTIAWVTGVRKDYVLKKYLDTVLNHGIHTEASYEKMEITLRNNKVMLSHCSNVDLGSAEDVVIDKKSSNQSDFDKIKNNNEIVCLRFMHHSPHPVDFIRNNTHNSYVASLRTLVFEHPNKHLSPNSLTGYEVKVGSNDPIPSIVHYIWFGRKRLSFSMYLSFLSSVNIIHPSVILIHTDCMLEGTYWDTIKQNLLVHVIYRESPRTIFGHRILYTQHKSDVVRADVLEKYGGIYLDWDAIWVRSLKDLLQTRDEVILSRDHIPRPPFPDTINMGVALAKPRSDFIRRWRASLVNYRSKDFLYNAVELPYKIYEAYPNKVYIYDRLQAICYFLKCHPAFHPDFKHWGRAQPFDWKTDVRALHFTHPDPPAFLNETALAQASGMFADIGRFILNSGNSASGG